MTEHANFAGARLRAVNDSSYCNANGRYVLYWMQLYRRLDHNHALNHAAARAAELKVPLVVYEGLKLGYPWASWRLHAFILQGMQANRQAAARLGLNYWPFVETPASPGRGLLRRLAADAALIVTDDFPAFIIPEQTAALAARTDTPVLAVDGNCVVPLALLGAPVLAAAHLRHRLHRHFATAWRHRAATHPRLGKSICRPVDPPFKIWDADDVDRFLATLPLDRTVPPLADRTGGAPAARKRLREFVTKRLRRFAEHRSEPASPERCPASGLSPYLHFGHISIEEVVARVLESVDWKPDQLSRCAAGKRQGFFCEDANVNSFLDEALTWRDTGFLWHWHRRADVAKLETALPAWAVATLSAHAGDARDPLYSAAELEAGATHDPLWNAAQRELVATGTIHNYLRMLWGKKIIEWTESPERAYQILVHLNNKYALDGRNPNSYSGILWCFGLFDHPWQERKIFGKVRYMSSENTARKFDLTEYLEYVNRLPTIAEVTTRNL